MSKTILKDLLTEAAQPAAPMRLPDLVEPIRSHLQALFPNSVFSVHADVEETSICDDVTIRFALEPKAEWPSGIWHNASNFLATIWPGQGSRRDRGTGIFKVELSMSRLPVKFVGRTGTGPQIIKHVNGFFTKVKDATAAAAGSDSQFRLPRGIVR